MSNEPPKLTAVIAWPLPTVVVAKMPARIKRPCDWGLEGAVSALEIQLGTIEAYNRLVEITERMRADIEAGRVEAQNPLYAVSVKG